MEKERTKEKKREREREKERKKSKRKEKGTSAQRFTSDSMTLRGSEGPMELDGVCVLTHAELLPSRRKSERNAIAFYGVWSSFYGDRLPRLRRVIDRDPIVSEREFRASALSTGRHVYS